MNKTEKDIREGNKLIAEFAGWKFVTHPIYRPEGSWDNSALGYGHWSAEAFKYHSSWDWLMPVVEKIWSLGGWEFVIFANGCSINGDHEQPPYISVTDGGSTISSTWKAVIKFIEWHNKTPKQ